MRILDYSSWDEFEGNAEGSGRSEKIWLNSSDEIGLFKFPKQFPDSNSITTEHISEKLASDLAGLVSIPCARVEIGRYNGRLGSMSYRINKDNEILIEGISFISRVFPDYIMDKLYIPSQNYYYSIPVIYPIVKALRFSKEFLEMMVFDALIGNSDRHHSNWAVLVSRDFEAEFSPLYDNGSSLCCYVNEADIDGFLGKDKRRFESLITTKSRSLIRIDGSVKRLPTHIEVLSELLNNTEFKDFCSPIVERILDTITGKSLTDVLSEYPDSLVSEKRKTLLFRFLSQRVKRIEELYCNKGG